MEIVDEILANRVGKNVKRRGAQVIDFSQRMIVEASLPERTGLAASSACLVALRLPCADERREGGAGAALDEKMDVIGHEAIRKDTVASASSEFIEKADAFEAEVDVLEDIRAGISADRDGEDAPILAVDAGIQPDESSLWELHVDSLKRITSDEPATRSGGGEPRPYMVAGDRAPAVANVGAALAAARDGDGCAGATEAGGGSGGGKPRPYTNTITMVNPAAAAPPAANVGAVLAAARRRGEPPSPEPPSHGIASCTRTRRSRSSRGRASRRRWRSGRRRSGSARWRWPTAAGCTGSRASTRRRSGGRRGDRGRRGGARGRRPPAAARAERARLVEPLPAAQRRRTWTTGVRGPGTGSVR